MKWFIAFVVVIWAISINGNERTKKRLEDQNRQVQEMIRKGPGTYRTRGATYDELHDTACDAGLDVCGGVTSW